MDNLYFKLNNNLEALGLIEIKNSIDNIINSVIPTINNTNTTIFHTSHATLSASLLLNSATISVIDAVVLMIQCNPIVYNIFLVFKITLPVYSSIFCFKSEIRVAKVLLFSGFLEINFS